MSDTNVSCKIFVYCKYRYISCNIYVRMVIPLPDSASFYRQPFPIDMSILYFNFSSIFEVSNFPPPDLLRRNKKCCQSYDEDLYIDAFTQNKYFMFTSWS